MIQKNYESELPVTNQELYEMLGRVTVEDLDQESLQYTCNSGGYVRRFSLEGIGNISVREVIDVPSIIIVSNQPIGQLPLKRRLEGLLRSGVREIVEEKSDGYVDIEKLI